MIFQSPPVSLPMEWNLSVPKTFSFKRTVLSHGWCALPPFSFDKKNWTLTRVLLVSGEPRKVSIREGIQTISVRTNESVSEQDKAQMTRDVRHMLRLDDDLDPFYRLASQSPEFEWIKDEGAGRLLRSPSVFEDLFKMMCTTNCSWSLTERMIDGIMKLGPAFPSAQQIAEQPLRFFTRISAGYRAPFLKALAAQIAAGKINPEAWLHWKRTAAELKKEMKQIKGVGDYVAENMLKLVGNYDGLALDSWIRKKFRTQYGNGRSVSDQTIERRYKKFGSWKGLALWCDMTRDWLESV